LADIGFRQPVAPVSVEGNGFEGGAAEVPARRGEGGSQLVGYLDGDGHQTFLALSILGFRRSRKRRVAL
jgi:hypothetical protein